jgi:hypothetical protein
MGFRNRGSGFRIQGFGFSFWSLRFLGLTVIRIWGFRFWIWGIRFRVEAWVFRFGVVGFGLGY